MYLAIKIKINKETKGEYVIKSFSLRSVTGNIFKHVEFFSTVNF